MRLVRDSLQHLWDIFGLAKVVCCSLEGLVDDLLGH